jgi:hypothetical protein
MAQEIAQGNNRKLFQKYCIIKLEEKETGCPLTNEMLQAVKKQLFTEWLAQQRTASQIERYIGQ